jgi:hypothetical protein
MKKLLLVFAILHLINIYNDQDSRMLNENDVDIVVNQENADYISDYPLELSKNNIKKDVFNSDKISFISIYHLSESDCKNFIFEINEMSDKYVEITMGFEFEFICIEDGYYGVNEEFQRYADVKYYFKPEVLVTYEYVDGKWEVGQISENYILPEKSEEIEITHDYTAFNKDIGMIKEDLSDIISKPYFQIKHGFNPLTFVKDESLFSDFNKGYKLIDEVNLMDIEEIEYNSDDNNQSTVTILLDVNAENIHAVGKAELQYKLWNDELGNAYWRLVEINQDCSSFEVSSIATDNEFIERQEVSNIINSGTIDSLLEQSREAELMFIEGNGIDFQKDSVRLGELHKVYNPEFRSYEDIRNYLLNIYTEGQHLEDLMDRIEKYIIENDDGYLYMSPGYIKTGLSSITDEYIIEEIDDENQTVIFNFYKIEKYEYTGEVLYDGPYDIKLKYDADKGWRLDDWVDRY